VVRFELLALEKAKSIPLWMGKVVAEEPGGLCKSPVNTGITNYNGAHK
jgi:hypothetical protein